MRVTALVMIAALTNWAGLAHGQEAAADTSRPQPGPWNYGAAVGLNLAQSTYSSNWAGGDKGSVNWVLNSDMTAEKQFTHWFNWSNQLELSYGQTSNQVADPDGGNRIVYDVPEKTTDLIRLESTGRFSLDHWLDPYAGLRIESQFWDEGDPIGGIGLNPIQFSQSAGVAHVFADTKEQQLISRAGLSVREVYARAFTDSTGENTHAFTNVDGGFEWLTTVTQPLLDKAVVYKGRLLVFYPVFFSDDGDLSTFDELARMADPARESVKDFWKAVDVNFQSTFTTAITKHLSVNLFVQLIYQKYDRATNLDLTKPLVTDLIPVVDAGIRKAGQFKQTLALGFTYTLL